MRAPRPVLTVLAVSALVLALLAVGLASGLGAPGSALSRDPAGWAVARAYLEARGVEVTLADRPEALAPGGGVLALVSPFQRGLTRLEQEAILGHLRGGGSVLYAYSSDRLGSVEEDLRSTLRLGSSTLRDDPPLLPWRWWPYRRERWRLQPALDLAAPGLPALEVPAILSAPTAVGTPRVLYTALSSTGAEAEAIPLVFEVALQRGRVVALPAALLANSTLGSPGHADFLETLRRALGDRWTFDELHHGLVAPDLARQSLAARGWDLFVVHLLLFYGLALVALARRFGPPWRETPAAAGSTAAFLRSLGALHHELGHHAAAAPVLLERARLLDPGLLDPAQPAARALAGEGAAVANGAGLVALSRKIAAAQGGRRPCVEPTRG